MKSEPEAFSIDDLQKSPQQIAQWDGVRNYQARNMLRDAMKKGDLAFFYYSSCKTPGIVGIVEIVHEGYPDHTAYDPTSQYFDAKADRNNPRWIMVDVKFKTKFPQMITLEELKQHPALSKMKLLQKGNRLSILPIDKNQWNMILGMVK